MAAAEGKLMEELQLLASQAGGRLFRNNSGKYVDRQGNWVVYGVGTPGGSDLIGFMPVTITQEMVGRRVAVFTAVEAKTGKLKPTKFQDAFIEMVRAKGGLATWGTDAQEVMGDIEDYTNLL